MRRAILLCAIALCISAGGSAQSSSPSQKRGTHPMAKPAANPAAALQAARASFAKLPLSFEENQGQTDPRVKYVSRGSGYNLFLTNDEAVLALHSASPNRGSAKETRDGAALWLKMLGGDASAQVFGSDPLPGKINYYAGNDPSKWHTGIRQYGKVTYRGIYPGVDLTYYGNQQQLESDFIVAPGADPRSIEFKVAGASATRLDAMGNLVLVTSAGNVQLLRPIVYQTIHGIRHDVSGRYVLRAENRVGFQVGPYDARQTLVIDPTLVYSTYLGGSSVSSGDMANAIAIDASGKAYVTGSGTSSDFPGDDLNGPPVVSLSGYAFVTVFDATGSSAGASLVYSTILTGSANFETTTANGIAVDGSGNAYIAGTTETSNFPMMNPFQSTFGAPTQTGFVAGVKSDGTLIYSTYLGGRNADDTSVLYGVAADSSGDAYVVGISTSANFPTVNPYQSTLNGTENAVVAKFNPQGQPIYSTYLGGNSYDYGYAIAADSGGNAYVTGMTESTNFPVQTSPVPFQTTLKGSSNLFISKFSYNSTSSTLTLANSTYLGGSGSDVGFGIAVDSATPPNVYLTGDTTSSNVTTGFPIKTPAPQSTFGGSTDAFVTKLKGDFTALTYSTFLGGTGSDIANAIALDGANPPNAFVTGKTTSTNFPTVSPFQSALGSGTATNAFVAEVNGAGSAFTYSTYFGGNGVDQAHGIAVDSSDNAYIAGQTTSPNFPVLSGAAAGTKPFQDQLGNSSGSAFVAKISPTAATGLNLFPPVFNFHTIGVGQKSFTETVMLTNNTASAVTINSGGITFGGANPGDFAQTSTCPVSPATLAVGASCPISVTFSPTDQDSRTATLNVATTSPSATMNLSGNGGVPEASFSTTSINFSSAQPLNVQTSGSVTITNTGGAPLQIGSAQISASTPSNAAVFSAPTSSTSCFSAPIAPGSSCFLSVTFTPLAATTYNATLLISDNAAGSPQTVSLTGTGVQVVTVSPISLEMGPNVVGSTSINNANEAFLENGSGGTITITETPGTGPDQGDFHVYSQLDTCATVGQLAAGGSCRLGVYFQPLAASATDGRIGSYTLGWTGALAGSQTVTVMGTGVTGVSLYTNTLTAPNEYVGITEGSSGLEAIFNGTANPITITTALSGNNPGDFTSTLDSSCAPAGIIPAYTYCQVSLSFTPSALGLRTVTVNYDYTGDNGVPLVLNGSGTGIPGPATFPFVYDFGSEIIGTSTPRHVFEFRNVSTVPITISSVTLPVNADFAVTDTSCSVGTIPAGGVCFIGIKFAPSTTTAESSTLVITDSFGVTGGADPGSPHTLTLKGTGEPSVITVSVSSGGQNLLDFGNVSVSPATVPQAEIFLTNAGNAPTTITWTGGTPVLTTSATAFSLVAVGNNVTTCTQGKVVLPQGGSCLIGVSFNPTTSGEQTNSVTFSDSVGGSHTVNIQGNGVPQASIQFNPTSLNFNQVPTSPVSAGPAQMITLTNSSSVATGAPLTITGISMLGTNVSSFALASGAGTICSVGAVVNPGSSCNFYITFTALTLAGSYSGYLQVQSNLGNGASSSNYVFFDGNSLAGGFTLSPAAPIDFGAVAVGSTTTSAFYTLTNENATSVVLGAGSLQVPTGYTVAYDGCSSTTITSQNECFFEISFTPTSASTNYNGNLQIAYTGASGSPFLIALKGSGVAGVVANPNPDDFGTVTPGSEGYSSVTIQNGGASTATITSVSTPSPSTGFAISYNGCPNPTALPATAGCTMNLTFTPPGGAAAGTTSTTITVGYSIGGTAQTPITVTLKATISAAQAVVVSPVPPAPLNFSNQTVNTQSQVLNVILSNSASASQPLSISGFRISGANANDFALAAYDYSTGCQYAYLEPGQTCTIAITFTPSNVGARTATLTITDNSSPTTQTVTLTGTGTGGTVSASPTTLTFPQTNVGSSLTMGAILSNTTVSAVTINSVVYSGPFSSATGTNACGTTLGAVTGTCVVYSKFSPTGISNNGTATVTYNGTSTVVITLNGAGFNPGVTATPNPLNFSAELVGTSSAPQAVAVSNPTASAVTISGTPTIVGTNPSDFSLGTNSCTSGFSLPASTGTCTVNIIFTPGASGGVSRTATLSIPASDPNAPHLVTLNGTATEPVATLSTNTLAFGNSNVNVTTAQMTATLSNTGNATLTGITTVLSGAGFAFATPNSGTDCRTITSLTAGSNCVVAATFTPTSTSPFGGSIKFTDSASPSTQTLNLTGTGTQPLTTFNPPTVAFGNQRLNVASSQMIATLNNTGTGPLTIGSVVLAGSNPGDFTLVVPGSGSDCRTIGTVSAGASCTVAATFTPAALGSRTATVTITDDASPSTQAVTLAGIGVFPQATPSPSPLAFGNQRENAASGIQAITLNNGGTDTLHLTTVALGGTNAAQFAIAAGTTCTNGSTVAAGASCVVNLTFTPNALTAFSATVTFTDDANPTTQVVNLTGTGVFPQASATPATVPFGNQRESAASAAQTITLTNAGTGTLDLTSFALGGTNPGDFAFVAGTTCLNGGTVAPASSCVVKVTFTPTALGSRSATVMFTDDASPTTQTVNLTGTGVFPQASPAPATLPFGNQANGATSAAQTITLTNGGTATLNLTTVALGGTNPGAFAIAAGTTCTNGGTVGAGSSCIVNVTFTPTGLSPFAATITFTDDASPTTQVVNLSGTGVSSTVNFSSGVVAFGNQRTNTTSAQMSSILTNSGSTTLTITGVTLTGANPTDFALATPNSGTDCRTIGTVAPAGTCTIAATFTPLALGSLTATVSVADNASGSPHTFQLTGTGTFPQATPTPSPVAFGNQRTNTTSGVQALTLTNGGTDTLHLTTVVLGGTNANQYAIATGTTCTNGSTVAAGASCIVNLTFTPTTLGAKAATVTFTDDANPVTQVVNLSGTGVFPQAAAAPATIPFGNQRLNLVTTAQTITLSNAGTGTLNLTSVVLGGTNPGDYTIATGTTCTNGGTVAPSSSCIVNVTFTPTALGSRAATVTFTDDASPTTQSVTLTGTGVFPQASPAPATVPFGNQSNGSTSAAQTITLSNAGTGTLNLTTVALGGTNPGAFAMASGTTCTNGGTVAAGSSCIVKVTFTPTGLTPFAATLTFTDDANPTTQVVNLTGTGVASTVNFNPGTVPFGNQRTNTTSAQMSSILTNSGSTTLTISGVTLTGTNPTDFALVTPSSGTDCRTIGTVAPAGVCTIAATFTPLALGALNATVSVADSANGSPHTFQLTGTGTFPQATPTPSPLAFANQIQTTTSGPQTVTLTNTGTDTLHLTTVALGGTNAADFAIVAGTTTCTNGSTIAPAGSCVVNLTFTPASATSFAATITFTDDANPTTQVVNLTGTGVTPPTATQAPTSLAFGNQRVAATSAGQSVTITNSGGAPLNVTSIAFTGTNSTDFAFASPATTCPTAGGQVPPNSNCTLSVTFDPAATGARSASIAIAVSGIGNPAPVTLTGTGIAPVAAAVPTTETFVGQEVSTTSAAQGGTLNNTGTDVLHITAVAISGTNAGDFSIVAAGTSCETGLPTPVSVAASANCTWSVKFTPTATGTRTATLTFTDDSNSVTGSTQSVSLTGTGTAPAVVLAPTTVAFPAQAVATTSSAQSGTLTNTGTTALHITNVTITGPNASDFAIATGTTCTGTTVVAATNGTCNWSVTFTPSANGTRTASLQFTDDDKGVTGSTQTVPLSGITPAAAVLTPSPLPAFGNQGVGTTSSPTAVTLTNPGGSPLHVTTVAIGGANAGDFAVASGTTCTNSTVQPNATCTINVTFTPTAAGSRAATLTVTDDATPTTQTLALSGTAIDFTLAIPTPPAAATAGQPITATIQITPGPNGFPNPITFAASNLPPGSTGTFSTTILNSVTSQTTVTFTLMTSARSSGTAPRPSHPASGPPSTLLLTAALLALLGIVTLRRGFRTQRMAYLPLAVLLLSAAIISGCASGPTGTPAGNYNVTVTATSGAVVRTVTIPVTVQ